MNTNQRMRDMVVMNYLQSRAPIMMLDLDEQYIVREANQYARSLLGSDCVGTVISLLVVDFNSCFDPKRLRTMPSNSLLSFKSPGGVPVSLNVSFLPLGNAGILVGEHNLQETEELQTTLMHLNGELNSISRDLQKKTGQLQHANALKDQLMGMAAHDLRNPLAGVYSYLELLLEDLSGANESPLTQPLQEIHREVDYMLNLVTNLLDYSVIDRGRLDLVLQEVNLHELLPQVVQINRLLANRRRIQLTLQISTEPEHILLDVNRIRQVLNNLLSNAIKYTPEAGEVLLVCRQQEDQLLLQVLDQGAGVPPAEQTRLFTPFGRTSTQSLSGEKSTGLGLSICKKIVEAHGGQVWEENRPEGGACFNVTLPRHKTHQKGAQP